MTGPVQSYEFEIGGRQYQARRMHILDQAEVATTAFPLITAGFLEMITLHEYMAEHGILAFDKVPLREAAKILPGVSHELTRLRPEDRKALIGTILSHVERKRADGPGWEPLWSLEAGMGMFDDINYDLMLVLMIMREVFQRQFRSFFPASLFDLFGGAKS